MGVAEVVRTVAKAIAGATNPTDPQHRIGAQILRLMPDYRDAQKLLAWESAFKDTNLVTDESEVGRMLYAVFDFGRLNLYGDFNVPLTVEQFGKLSGWLAERGVVVAVPEPRELHKW